MLRFTYGLVLASLGALLLHGQPLVGSDKPHNRMGSRTGTDGHRCLSQHVDLLSELRNRGLEEIRKDPANTDSSSVGDFAQMLPQLRKFPYPYRCALAIVPDVDRMSRKEFLAVHQFLNTNEDTFLNTDPDTGPGMGTGVGLEIAASFWMFNDNSDFTVDGLSYFDWDGESFKKSPDADLIRTYFHAGYIDCIHSFGHFGTRGNFSREIALFALDEMRRSGILPLVWSNHGGGDESGNIGRQWNRTSSGDIPGTKAYHTDVSTYPEGPIRFFWRSGGTGTVSELGACTISPVELFDNRTIIAFSRYSGPRWDPEALPSQISKHQLSRLIDREGFALLATHLSARGWPTPVFFSSSAQRSLRELESHHRSGDIYVTTTSKLLWYRFIHENLVWRYTSGDDSVMTIHIDNISDPVGVDFVPTLEDLQGITFFVPTSTKIRVVVGDEDVTDSILENPPDHTNRASVSFPLTYLPQFPEWTSDGYTYKTEDYDLPEYNYTVAITNIDNRDHTPKLSYVGLHAFGIRHVSEGNLFHVYVPDSISVNLSKLRPGDTTEPIEIVNGVYDESIPRLVRVECDDCVVEEAVYDSANHLSSVTLNGTGKAILSFDHLNSPFADAECRISHRAKQTVAVELNGPRTFENVQMAVFPDHNPIKVMITKWDDGHEGTRSWIQTTEARNVSVRYRVGGLNKALRCIVSANGVSLGTFVVNDSGELCFDHDTQDREIRFELEYF